MHALDIVIDGERYSGSSLLLLILLILAVIAVGLWIVNNLPRR